MVDILVTYRVCKVTYSIYFILQTYDCITLVATREHQNVILLSCSVTPLIYLADRSRELVELDAKFTVRAVPE